MAVSIPNQKGGQEGKFSFPEHLYCNSYVAHICLFPGLAIYNFSRELNDRWCVLFGLQSEARFSKWACNI